MEQMCTLRMENTARQTDGTDVHAQTENTVGTGKYIHNNNVAVKVDVWSVNVFSECLQHVIGQIVEPGVCLCVCVRQEKQEQKKQAEQQAMLHRPGQPPEVAMATGPRPGKQNLRL